MVSLKEGLQLFGQGMQGLGQGMGDVAKYKTGREVAGKLGEMGTEQFIAGEAGKAASVGMAKDADIRGAMSGLAPQDINTQIGIMGLAITKEQDPDKRAAMQETWDGMLKMLRRIKATAHFASNEGVNFEELGPNDFSTKDADWELLLKGLDSPPKVKSGWFSEEVNPNSQEFSQWRKKTEDKVIKNINSNFPGYPHYSKQFIYDTAMDTIGSGKVEDFDEFVGARRDVKGGGLTFKIPIISQIVKKGSRPSANWAPNTIPKEDLKMTTKKPVRNENQERLIQETMKINNAKRSDAEAFLKSRGKL